MSTTIKLTVSGDFPFAVSAANSAAAAAASAATASSGASTATTQAAIATTQATTATTAAATATTQAGVATTQATNASTSASAAAVSASSATATLTSVTNLAVTTPYPVFPTTAAATGNGVKSTTGIVAGSGGTNGQFDVAFSGGGATVQATARFTVAGGALTSITITSPGYGYTSAPTMAFTASTGLTGASATAVIGANVVVGGYFYTPSSDNRASSQFYRVDAGPTATLLAKPISLNHWYDQLVNAYPKIRTTNSFAGNALNGATFNSGTDIYAGITIPAATTGYQTYIISTTGFTLGRAQSLAGKTIRLVAQFETSANALSARGYVATTQVQIITGQTGALGTFSNTQLVQVTSTMAIVVTDLAMNGIEGTIKIGLQQGSNSVGDGTSHTIKPIAQFYQLLSADSFNDTILLTDPEGTTYSKTITVKPDGTGNYTTLKAALAAEGGGINTLYRVLYQVYEGVYTDISHSIPEYVDIVGIGRRDYIWFKGEQADSASTTDITNNSTFDMNKEATLKNLKITGRNVRYAIHADAGSVDIRALQIVEDCYIEHYGNDGARAWQAANGGNPALVWYIEQAWGCGTHNGNKIYSRRTEWVSPWSTFGFHTNKDFTLPCYVELDQCRITNTKGGIALSCISAGTNTPDAWVIRNCQVNGTLNYQGAWISTTLSAQRGNETDEISVNISGCTPFAWSSQSPNSVLELRSIDSATSAVVVSGTGADALFGTLPVYIYGGIGYPARVYSNFAITSASGAAGVGLGARLGDCTTVNKTLSITFDGSISNTITLNQNYTAMTNAAVVSALNTALADATRAFYVSTPYENFGAVYQTDRELRITNTSTTTVILKGMAVALDGNPYKGRIATSSDSRAAIAGIALENIAPGKIGRIQQSGQIFESQLSFSSTPSITFGDVFGVGATAGKFTENASVTLLRSIGTSAAPTLGGAAVNVFQIV